MGPAKWTYFYLYAIIDIFSRRVVAWLVADAESAALFKPLFEEPPPSTTSCPASSPCTPIADPHESQGHRPVARRPRRHQVP